MAKAKPIRGLAPDTHFRDAAAAAVSVRATEVFAFGDAALDVSEIEGVHDMRVATRRLRAALEVFAPCFPSKPHAAVLKEVKELADRLGDRRDPDVALEELEALAERFGPADQAGVAGLMAELRIEQAAANELVARALADVHERALPARLQELAEAARS
jgi:CHAD domain-containing protein